MRSPRALLVILIAALQPARPPAPDLVIHNAVIHTVDDGMPRAEAIAVAAGRIVAVGSSSGILTLRGPSTRVVDARGATIVPGLQDAHGHFASLGQSLRMLDLRGTSSFEEVVARVRRKV